MPTVKRFGSASVCLYADDHHPAHFHIVGADFQVLVRISDLTIIKGDAKTSQIAEAMEWARTNRESLLPSYFESVQV